jgi:hypothetical protein
VASSIPCFLTIVTKRPLLANPRVPSVLLKPGLWYTKAVERLKGFLLPFETMSAVSFPKRMHMNGRRKAKRNGQRMGDTLFSFLRHWVWTQNLTLARRYSTTWATPPTLSALVIVQIGSCAFVWAGLDCKAPIYTSCSAGMTGSSHQDLGWPQTTILPICASFIAGITGMSHHTREMWLIFQKHYLMCCVFFQLP